MGRISKDWNPSSSSVLEGNHGKSQSGAGVTELTIAGRVKLNVDCLKNKFTLTFSLSCFIFNLLRCIKKKIEVKEVERFIFNSKLKDILLTRVVQKCLTHRTKNELIATYVMVMMRFLFKSVLSWCSFSRITAMIILFP
jgi:hypothetical protein